MLHRARRLSSEDLALAAEALWLIVRVRWLLGRHPLAEVQSRLAASSARRPHAPSASAVRIREAIARAHRRLPSTKCLALALVAQVMLQRAGREARFVIGVARDGGGGRGAAVAEGGTGAAAFDAHAWTESDGVIVAGEGALERYTPLVRRASDLVRR